MSELAVLDPSSGHVSKSESYVDHSALRTATFTVATGTPVAEDDVTFENGARGVVSAWNGGTKTLSYYLLSADLEPALGENATCNAATLTACSALDHGGDEWVNDGLTWLAVKNIGEAILSVLLPRFRKCQDGVAHIDRVDIGPGQEIEIGPFSRIRFNDPTGRMRAKYAGSLGNSDVGVVPIRRIPRS